MPVRLPPLNPLRAFEAAARRGSVSAAARELNVTHGAVSHQIKTLEDTLAVRLFERGGKRLRLTPEGALLFPAVTKAFEDIAAATALLARPQTSGAFKVACVPALLSFWLLPRLSQFTGRFPDISLTLIASNDPALLHAPDVDLCLLYGNGRWPEAWVRLWSSFELFPVVSPTLLSSRPLRSVRDLRDHVLLHGDDGGEWQTWLAAADALDLPRAQQHFMSDARLSTEAALNGQGVALGDAITASTLVGRGDLIIPFDLSVPAKDAYYVACRPAAKATPIAQVFIDWLFASLESERLAEPQGFARHIVRSRAGKAEAVENPPPHGS